jgi:hypothetical protein
MTAGDQSGNRCLYGPRSIGTLLPGITRPAFRKRSPAAAQLIADWAILVGPALAAQTHPKRLSGDTLTIACNGPMAMELQHLAPELMSRINSQLGQVVVGRLRFVQETVTHVLPPPVRKPVLAEKAAREAVSGLQEGPLRDALEALGRRVLAHR